MRIKDIITEVSKLLSEGARVPVVPVFTGRTEAEMAETLAQTDSGRACCVVPESGSLKSSNTAPILDRLEFACYYAALFESAALDGSRPYTDDIEEIISALHCRRVCGSRTLRSGSPAFKLVRNSAGLLIFALPFTA